MPRNTFLRKDHKKALNHHSPGNNPIFVGSSPIQPQASSSSSSSIQPAIQPSPALAPISSINAGNISVDVVSSWPTPNPPADNEPSGWSPGPSPWGPSAWDSTSSWNDAQHLLSSDEEDTPNIGSSTTLLSTSVGGASQIASSNPPPARVTGPSRPRSSLPNFTEPIQTTSHRARSASPTPRNAQTPLQRQISRHRVELAANRQENPNDTVEEIEPIRSLIYSSPTLVRDLPPSSPFLIQPSTSRVTTTQAENQPVSAQSNASEPVWTEAKTTSTQSNATEPVSTEAQVTQVGTHQRRRRPPTLQERRSLAADAAERQRLEIQEEIRVHLEEGLRAESSMVVHV